MECIFTLKYDVGDQRCDPDALVEHLGAAGCTDALVGTGPGSLAREFTAALHVVDGCFRQGNNLMRLVPVDGSAEELWGLLRILWQFLLFCCSWLLQRRSLLDFHA